MYFARTACSLPVRKTRRKLTLRYGRRGSSSLFILSVNGTGGRSSVPDREMRGGQSYAEAAKGPGHPEIKSNGDDAVRSGEPAPQLREQVREVQEKPAEQQSNTETRKELEKMKVLLR